MFLALILILFDVFSTVVTIRVWLGKPPAKRSKLRDENFLRSGTLESFSPAGSYNLNAKGVYSALIPGVLLMWTIAIADLLISQWPRRHFTHEFVSIDFGLAAICAVLIVPLYLRGRPRGLVPPPLRKYWLEK
jgi:hypothetical protein